MKKGISGILILALLLTMLTPMFALAAETPSSGEILKDLGVIQGDGTSLMEDAQWNRQDLAVILSRLLGAEDAAKATAKSHTYADVKNSFYDGYLSWAKQNGYLEGYSATKFGIGDKVTNQQFTAVMLRALGYDTTGANYALVPGYATNLGLAAEGTDWAKAATRGDYYDVIVKALGTEVKGTDLTLGAKLNLPGFEQDLAVLSVEATSATKLLVKFNKAVDETDAETVAKYSIGGVNPTSAVLQADKTSVVLTMAAKMEGTKLYIVDPVKSAADATEKSPIFTFVAEYSDTVSPVVTKVEYPTYNKATVSFSEPVKSLGSVVATIDGATVALPESPAFVAGDSSVTYDLSALAADKDIVVTIVGARDQADNLISSNPTTVTLKKVKSDTTKPVVTEVKALSDVRVEVTFSEKLSANPTVTVGGNAVTFPAYDSTKENVKFTGTFTATTGVQVVAVSAYTDMSGNTGDNTSRVVQLTADTTATTLVSSSIKTFSNKQYLVLTFNEDVTAVGGNLSGTRVKDYISYSFAAAGTVPVAYTKANGADVDDTKSIMLDISNDTTYPIGAYTITVPAGYAKDLASTPNNSAQASVSFTKGTLTVSDTTAPTVNAVPTFSADNQYMTVVYSEAMSAATALNVNNYKVSGASIFSSAIFDGNANTVKLTVIPGTLTVTGDRLVTVSGVTDAAGNALASTYSKIINIKENVKPVVSSATLVDSKTIKVTLSENVTTAGNSFEVYVAGTKVASTDPALVVAGNQVTITLTNALDDLSKTLQVKLVDATTVDANGNLAVTGSLVNVTK